MSIPDPYEDLKNYKDPGVRIPTWLVAIIALPLATLLLYWLVFGLGVGLMLVPWSELWPVLWKVLLGLFGLFVVVSIVVQLKWAALYMLVMGLLVWGSFYGLIALLSACS